LIALIDYGAGNLTSVKKALAATGAEFGVPERPADLAAVRGIIVPGVGHFGATRVLDGPWVDAIRARVDAGCALLGICLGMQWLYEVSDEAPELKGLGVWPGRVVRLSTGEVRLKVDAPYDGRPAARQDGASGFSRTSTIKVPHVGWNSLTVVRDDSIAAGVMTGDQVYFTHSYVAPVTPDTAAVTEHGDTFAAIVQRGRIAGVQFHPEKSGDIGLRILRNFVQWTS
jgi:imidazole glycerol-phosphate synthase subunit HisH